MPDEPIPVHHRADSGRWISWLGSPTQFLATGEETAGTYCLSRALSAPGGGAPPHRHDFEESFYLLRGQLRFTAGNQSFDLDTGDFINIGANVAHRIDNTSSAEAEVITLCAPAGFDQFQTAGGYSMDGPGGTLVPDSPEVRARILAAAAEHGVEMNPPLSAFEQAGRISVVRKNEGITIDTVGDRYRFLVRSAETAGRYALWEALIEPGGGPPPHIHTREEEGFLVLEGTLTFFTSQASFTAGPGEMVHLPRDGRHWFRNETSTPARALILVAPGGMEAMFLETGTPVDGRDAPPTPADPAEKARIGSAAPRFGVLIG